MGQQTGNDGTAAAASAAGVRASRNVLTNIQALRAIAALLVILFHLKELFAVFGLAPRMLSFAALGVDLFFVISGFIMVFTTDAAPVGGARFLKNRIARVVPIYWLMTGFVFALALAAPGLLSSTSADPADLLRSLFFIPYARPDGQMLPLLFLGWSLNYEMFFYLVFAGALAVGRGRHVEVAVAAIVGAFVIGLLVQPPMRTLASFYTNAKMLEFVAGMLIARALPRLPGSRGVGVAALIVGAAWLAATPLMFRGLASTLSAMGACSMIVIGALSAERAGAAVRWPAMVLLGDASYSLYLVHPFAAQAAIVAWRRLSPGDPAGAAVAIVLGVAASIAIAVPTYRLLELPLSRMARRLLDTRRQPVPARGL